MAKTATITLGDVTFEARAFTLGEQEEIIDALDAVAMAPTSKGKMAAARAIVGAAWAIAEPGKTAADVAAITAPVVALFEAAYAILSLAGLKSAPAGEAVAGTAPA